MEASEEVKKPTKREVLESAEEMLKSMDNLPVHAMYSPAMFSDHVSLLLLLIASLRADLDA